MRNYFKETVIICTYSRKLKYFGMAYFKLKNIWNYLRLRLFYRHNIFARSGSFTVVLIFSTCVVWSLLFPEFTLLCRFGKGTKHALTVEEMSQLEQYPLNPPGPVIHGFRFSIVNATFCSGEKNLTYFIAVSSATSNFERRQRIRKTWGDPSIWNGDVIKSRVGFLLGKPASQSLQKKIEDEQRIYGDIIQQDFLDTYRNLTFKSVMFLEHVLKFCMNAKYIVKVDDDVMVNVFILIGILQTKVTTANRTLFCNSFENTEVLREVNSKWLVEERFYKDKYYPTYCSGAAIIFTKDLIKDLYRATFHVPFIPVDDAYLTGIAARALGNVTHHQLDELQMDMLGHNAPLCQYAWWFSMWSTTPVASLPNAEVYYEVWRMIICIDALKQENYLGPKYLKLLSNNNLCR